MQVLNNSDLNKISGASDDSYMCTYSLIQYQYNRFDMLESIYAGNALEYPNSYKHLQDMSDMYLKWIDTHCSPEMKEKYMGSN